MARLDRTVAETLREAEEQNVPPITALTPSAARDQHRELTTTEGGPEVGRVRDLAIEGPGGDLPLRIYRPAGEGPFPVLLWIHGGGFVLGDLEAADPTCRALADGADCVVVSVDYRLAPEHPFPAAPDDCLAALEWTADHVATFDGDPDRIAVGGDSAGGNLAAVTALRARDEDGPDLVHQLLVYPVTTDDYSLPSRRENARGYGLTSDEMRWFDEQYLRNDADAANPYAYPLKARDLGDLPPATVVVAGFDPLRDDGVRYAERLEAAGVPTTLREYEDVHHGFFGMIADPSLDQAWTAIGDACDDLRDTFERAD